MNDINSVILKILKFIFRLISVTRLSLLEVAIKATFLVFVVHQQYYLFCMKKGKFITPLFFNVAELINKALSFSL